MSNQHTHTPDGKTEQLVSVVIPAYKATEFISGCLDSLRAQTHRPLEIIVVDDKSPDDGATIRHTERYAREHDIAFDEKIAKPLSVRVVQNVINGGCGLARAYGLNFVHGEYVIFLDSDDTLHPDAIEKMLDAAVSNDADLVKSEFELLHSDGHVSKVQNQPPRVFTGHDTLLTIARNIFSPPPHIRNINGPNGSTCGVLYRTELLKDPDIFFPPIPRFLSEDYIFTFRVLRKARTMVYYPTSFYRYRFMESSISHAVSADRLERAVAAAEYFEKTVRELEPDDDLSVMHARGYLIGSIISSCTIYLTSNADIKEMRRWFHAQRQIPIFKTLYEEYPWKSLPIARKLGFICFYKGHFYAVYAMIHGRRIAGKLFKPFLSRKTLS